VESGKRKRLSKEWKLAIAGALLAAGAGCGFGGGEDHVCTPSRTTWDRPDDDSSRHFYCDDGREVDEDGTALGSEPDEPEAEPTKTQDKKSEKREKEAPAGDHTITREEAFGLYAYAEDSPLNTCGLPASFWAVFGHKESSHGTNPAAMNKENSKGAMGFTQFLADTWEAFGEGGPENRKDARKSMEATVRYVCSFRVSGDTAEERMWQMFAHYFGGPDKSNWGPKTHGYANDAVAKQRYYAEHGGGRQDPKTIAMSAPGTSLQTEPDDSGVTVAAPVVEPLFSVGSTGLLALPASVRATHVLQL
jgi:hypothetical protein